MPLILLAYFRGILTIASPCILPVLPLVFARAGQPFLRSTIPMLTGMAGSFAAVATLTSVGGGWIVQANVYARYFAMTSTRRGEDPFLITDCISWSGNRETRPSACSKSGF